MILFPRPPKKFLSLMDHVAGSIEIPEEGISVVYERGVYYAHNYMELIVYKFEGNECAGPPPIKPILSPSDVVIPEAMLKPAPKPPKAGKIEGDGAPPAPPSPPAEE